MDLSKFVSRKLIATLLAVGAVAAATLMGAPLDQASLEAITSMVLGLVGAQGAVDTAAAWKAGTAIAETVEAVKELAPEEVAAEADAEPTGG